MKSEKILFYLVLVFFLSIIPFNSKASEITNNSITFQQENHGDHLEKESYIKDDSASKPISSNSLNYTNEILEEIRTAKLNDQATCGFFPDIHVSSIHATYYALFILKSIDNLNEINQTTVTQYIMSFYDPLSGTFEDAYVQRYLDMDSDKNMYYWLTSQLEINCYAVLSLEILNQLDLIDGQKMIDFIWSCYNPASSGFFGRPNGYEFSGSFNLSTADNTFYAVQALNCLMENWNQYLLEKEQIVQFLSDLQCTETGIHYGGFYNDLEKDFNSLQIDDTNLLASYYCLKILDLFQRLDSINLDTFHSYLSYLYNSEDHFFRMGPQNKYFSFDYWSLVSTALGLELAYITQFNDLNITSTLQYLLNNRNSIGTWDKSLTISNHELLYTFQIIRALNNTQRIGSLNTQNREEISQALELYYHQNGYSLLSIDYTTQDLLNTIVSVFAAHDQLNYLNVNEIYSNIERTFMNLSILDTYYFYTYTVFDQDEPHFRGLPIDYYSKGTHERYSQIAMEDDQESTFFALDTLNKLNMLDDFAMECDLKALLNSILSYQFLEPGFPNYGGFLPDGITRYYGLDLQNKYVYPEHTFYAVQTLQLLARYLGLGNISSLSLDCDALISYIINLKNETTSFLFFQPAYSENEIEILKTTYYFIYILKSLGYQGLDTQKIRNFLEMELKYNNIESLYYSFKINMLLALELNFNYSAIRNLITNIYSEELHEFFSTPSKRIVKQRYLAWVEEMAIESPLQLHVDYFKNISLESSNVLRATYYNMITNDENENITMQFESAQLGTIPLMRQTDDSFKGIIYVPYNANNYPKITGVLCVHNQSILQEQVNISFYTSYELNLDKIIVKENDKLTISINSSIITDATSHNLSNSKVNVIVSRNDAILDTFQLIITDHDHFSSINFSYVPAEAGTYSFEFMMENDFEVDPIFLFSVKELFITIISPSTLEIFGTNPPYFVLDARIKDLEQIWYSIGNNSKNHPFSNNCTLDPQVWNELDEGIINVTFYVNDSEGNIGFDEILIKKSLLSPEILIREPHVHQIQGGIAPNFDLNISIPISNAFLHESWYTLQDTVNTSGAIYFDLLTEFRISQTGWNLMKDGDVTVTFYANDTLGNIGWKSVHIQKDSLLPTITIFEPNQTSTFGIEPPSFYLNIEEINLNKAGYYLTNGTYTTSSTFLDYINYTNEYSQFTYIGNIDPQIWVLFGNSTLRIVFFADDQAGNVREEEVTVYKVIFTGVIDENHAGETPKNDTPPPDKNEIIPETPPPSQLSELVDLTDSLSFGLTLTILPGFVISITTFTKMKNFKNYKNLKRGK